MRWRPWQLYVQPSPPQYRDLGRWRLMANAPAPSDETVALLYGEIYADCDAVRRYLEHHVLHHDRDVAEARVHTLLRVLGREDLVPEESR